MELEQVWSLHSAEDGDNPVRSWKVPPNNSKKQKKCIDCGISVSKKGSRCVKCNGLVHRGQNEKIFGQTNSN